MGIMLKTRKSNGSLETLYETQVLGPGLEAKGRVEELIEDLGLANWGAK